MSLTPFYKEIKTGVNVGLADQQRAGLPPYIAYVTRIGYEEYTTDQRSNVGYAWD